TALLACEPAEIQRLIKPATVMNVAVGVQELLVQEFAFSRRILKKDSTDRAISQVVFHSRSKHQLGLACESGTMKRDPSIRDRYNRHSQIIVSNNGGYESRTIVGCSKVCIGILGAPRSQPYVSLRKMVDNLVNIWIGILNLLQVVLRHIK